VRWFYDTFDHPHQVKLLYVAASFVNRAAHHQANTGTNGTQRYAARAIMRGMSAAPLLARIGRAVLELNADEGPALTRAYLDAGYDRRPLVELLADTASKLGDDPHNQELGIC